MPYRAVICELGNGPLIEAGPSGDLDSDLRVVLLAIWADGDRRLAADFLRQSADKKMESMATTEPAGDPVEVTPLARWYTNSEVSLLDWRNLTPYNYDWVFASPYTNGKRPYWPESALADHIRPAAPRTKRFALNHAAGIFVLPAKTG